MKRFKQVQLVEKIGSLRVYIDDDGGVTLSKRGRAISVSPDEAARLRNVLDKQKDPA